MRCVLLTKRRLGAIAVFSAVSAVLVPASGRADEPAPVSPLDSWLTSWQKPHTEDRPLQIVHGIEPRYALSGKPAAAAEPTAAEGGGGMRSFADLGLGGIVCNVAFQDYLRSEEHWQTLVAGVERCREAGLTVWIYDEDGYPSGAAGGRVLEESPAYEATELTFDASQDPPFQLRPAYEHTHASNNYYAARRYANLIDDGAVRCFLDQTHEAYWKRLEPHFGATIRAFFTDEPSLIAINLGQIPEPARSRVRVVDPWNPQVKPLPTIPWAHDLPDAYRERYGEDLLAQRRSLFEGNSADDRRIRRQFWSLVADLVSERYFGAIQRWCQQRGVDSSGHTLAEESIVRHVPLEGNALQALQRMDVPGLDMLSSDPTAVIHSGWLTAALPSSAAQLNGRRRVMTEVSDFSQKMSGRGPATLAAMQATAAWQAAWGVTDFALYYGIRDRSADDYRAYCQYVGRLNTVLKSARFERPVLLYYPIRDLWEEYLPVAQPLDASSQSPRAQALAASFMRLGQLLQRTQIPCTLVDHRHLAKASVASGSPPILRAEHGRFEALVLPARVELPEDAARVVEAFRSAGGRIVCDDSEKPVGVPQLVAAIQPAVRLDPPSPFIAWGSFSRQGRRVMLAVNVGEQPYQGMLHARPAAAWTLLDPATGAVHAAADDGHGSARLELGPQTAAILVEAERP